MMELPGSDETAEKLRTWAAQNDEIALRLLPFRLVAWPVFLAIGIFEIFEGFQVGNCLEVVLHGYIGTTTTEFLKLLLGALIFAGLNAGLI